MSKVERDALLATLIALTSSVHAEDIIDVLGLYGSYAGSPNTILLEDMIEQIMLENTARGRMFELVNILAKRGRVAFYALVSALRDNGYEAAAELLCSAAHLPTTFAHAPAGMFRNTMTEEHSTAIKRVTSLLVDNYTDVVLGLGSHPSTLGVGKGPITGVTKGSELIAMRCLSPKDRARKILDHLLSRPDRCYYDLLQLLKWSGIDWILEEKKATPVMVQVGSERPRWTHVPNMLSSDDARRIASYLLNPTSTILSLSAPQSHVCSWRKKECLVLVTAANVERRRAAYLEFLEKVDVTPLLNVLAVHGLLNDDTVELISIQPTRRDKARECWARVRNTTNCNYYKWLAILAANGYEELVPADCMVDMKEPELAMQFAASMTRYELEVLRNTSAALASELAKNEELTNRLCDAVLSRREARDSKRLSHAGKINTLQSALPSRPRTCFYTLTGELMTIGHSNENMIRITPLVDELLVATRKAAGIEAVATPPSSSSATAAPSSPPRKRCAKRQDACMSRANKRRLLDHFTLIADNVDMNELVPDLIARGVLGVGDAHLSNLTPDVCTDRCIVALELGGSASYHEFIACLYKHGYVDVADTMQA
jgi:hypothetical protein